MRVQELTAETCHVAHVAMRELRPQVGDLDSYIAHVRRQFDKGYRMIAAFDEEHGRAISVAGFRVHENLAWGRHIYVDDLSTLPAGRGRGAASALLRWIDAEAAATGIGEVHLDSGVQAERQTAHRLYFAEGYRISCYHFHKTVVSEAALGRERVSPPPTQAHDHRE